jgi:hypothetical protein
MCCVVLCCAVLCISSPLQAWQRTNWMVDRLQLRSDQQAALIAGDSLFKHLVGQLLAARQELQQQQRQQAALRLPTGRAVDLTEQDQLAKRLQVGVLVSSTQLTVLG